MSESFERPSLGASVYYKDAFAALDWLEKAFGFERQMVITDNDGQLAHSEMRFGDSYVMICANGRKMRRARRRSAARIRSRCMCNYVTVSTSTVLARALLAR